VAREWERMIVELGSDMMDGWVDGWMDRWMETELITTVDPKLIRPDNAMRTNVVIRL
jgi:hypothetical protein